MCGACTAASNAHSHWNFGSGKSFAHGPWWNSFQVLPSLSQLADSRLEHFPPSSSALLFLLVCSPEFFLQVGLCWCTLHLSVGNFLCSEFPCVNCCLQFLFWVSIFSVVVLDWCICAACHLKGVPLTTGCVCFVGGMQPWWSCFFCDWGSGVGYAHWCAGSSWSPGVCTSLAGLVYFSLPRLLPSFPEWPIATPGACTLHTNLWVNIGFQKKKTRQTDRQTEAL